MHKIFRDRGSNQPATHMKLSQLGLFIKFCLLITIWVIKDALVYLINSNVICLYFYSFKLSLGFMLRLTAVSVNMCNYAVSNAVTLITFVTAMFLSLIMVCPKTLQKYQLVVNQN